MNKFTSGHPEYEDLLSLIDRDVLSTQPAVKRHVRECPKCRQDVDDCKAVTREFARFEEIVLIPAIPPPSRPWLDIREAMRQMDGCECDPGWLGRMGKAAGRILAGGTAIGCLAFALVLWNRIEAKHEEKPEPRPAAMVPVPKAVPKFESRRAPASPPSSPVDGAPSAVEPPVNTEVRVWAALHRLRGDLGEPIEVEARPDGRIEVGGAGLAPAREVEIREALSVEPSVMFHFSAPSSGELRSAAPSVRFEAVHSPLEPELRRYAGSEGVYQALSDNVLDESDVLLTHAHALRNLAQSFPPVRQTELHAAERVMLQEMIADHRAAFREHAGALLGQISRFGKHLGTPPAPTAQTSDALDAAQRMDSILSAIFGAARTDLNARELLAELSAASASLTVATGEPR